MEPDNGLSVLLLIEGAEFAPFVLAGRGADGCFDQSRSSQHLVTVLADFALTLGYAAFAAVLRDILKFSPRRANLADVISMLLAVPVGAALTSLIYCGTLYLAGSLPADQFYSALRHFWIGDTVGIIVIIPAATAAFTLLSKPRWGWRRNEALNWSVFIVGSCLVFALLHSASSANAYHLFYLLFLPIIWIGLRAGYVGVAIALLATQTAFFLTASYIGFDANDFDEFQILMLVLSITGLLLGAVVTERERANLLLREQQTELARVSAHATAGAMGMLLAHELSQPLSTVATYTLAARRMLRSGAGSEPVIDALGKAEAEAAANARGAGAHPRLCLAGKMEPRPLDLVEVAGKFRALCIEEANARDVDVAVETLRPIPLGEGGQGRDRAGSQQHCRQCGRRRRGARRRARKRGHSRDRPRRLGDRRNRRQRPWRRSGDGGEFVRGLSNVQAARNGTWTDSQSSNRAKARGSHLVAPHHARGDPVCGRAEQRWTCPRRSLEKSRLYRSRLLIHRCGSARQIGSFNNLRRRLRRALFLTLA